MGRGTRAAGARRNPVTWLASLLVVALAAFVIGCGDDDSDKGGSSKGSGGGDAVAKAEQVIAPYMEPPASVGTDVELSEKPPTGKKIVALSCTLDVCKNWRDNVAAAAKNLGWTSTSISFDGTPEDTLKKVNQAISQKPDGIIINGVPRETFEAAAAAAAKQGVPIVTQMGELEGEVVEPFIAVQYQAPTFDKMAKATANWVIADSDGKANAISVGYANFPLSERVAKTMQETVEADCPDCKSKVLRAQAADTGTKLPASIVSEIQRDPTINYVMLQDCAMGGGMVAALREAGLLDKVKIVCNNATPEMIQSTLDGETLGVMAFSLRAAAYAGVDALARHMVGDEVQDVPLMNQIFSKETLPAKPTPDTWENVPPDLEEQYKKLWKVAG